LSAQHAAIAEEAARTAGALLLERFGSERALDTTKSSPTDLVSEADLLAERAIRDVLARRAPDDAIMGEEGADTPGTSGRRWIVDPLDGTINFLYGIPQWAVSVACEGVAGAVFDPCRDELFVAADGAATLNGEPLEASRCDDLVPERPQQLARALDRRSHVGRDAGKLPGRKLGDAWRFSRAALVAWLSTPEKRPELR